MCRQGLPVSARHLGCAQIRVRAAHRRGRRAQQPGEPSSSSVKGRSLGWASAWRPWGSGLLEGAALPGSSTRSPFLQPPSGPDSRQAGLEAAGKGPAGRWGHQTWDRAPGSGLWVFHPSSFEHSAGGSGDISSGAPVPPVTGSEICRCRTPPPDGTWQPKGSSGTRAARGLCRASELTAADKDGISRLAEAGPLPGTEHPPHLGWPPLVLSLAGPGQASLRFWIPWWCC